MEATISSASSPTANQPSCRSTTPPPARPMCRLASVVALRTTSPVIAPSSGQSTFCSSRRSIPPRTLTPPSSLDFEGRDLLEEDRVEDLAGDGRRHRAAMAATLDEHDHHDLRVLRRRERREPGVVLTLGGFGVAHGLR